MSFAALNISDVITNNQNGVFDLMIKDIEKSSGVLHEYHVVPTARGAEMFFKNKVDCALPASTYKPYYKNHDVIFSESFSQVSYHAFTRIDEAVITDISQLKNKLVGIIRDRGSWDLVKRFELQDSTIVKVNDIEALVGMLNKKHIDVAIHGKGFISFSRKLGYPKPNYSKENPVAVDELSIICHKNARNIAYIETVNPYIRQIVKSGKMNSYRGKELPQ